MGTLRSLDVLVTAINQEFASRGISGVQVIRVADELLLKGIDRSRSHSVEEHTVRTTDGWAIQLGRYPAPGEPVLFVHGMGANRFNFDLNQRHSLARYLNAEGYDCWVVELRGRGSSPVPVGAKADWTFDDFLQRDLPAAIARVRLRNRKPMHWVGHSMGGTLGIGWAARYDDGRLASLVGFGVPLVFRRHQWMLRLWGTLAQMHRVVPTMDQEKWGRRMLPLMSRNRKALDFFLRFLANPDNVDAETTLDIFEKLVTNEAPGLILQFSEWVRRGEVFGGDGFSYTKHLAQVRVPVVFFCGSEDRMAPAENLRPLLAAFPAGGARLIELSRSAGFSIDYGHGDLIVGRNAPQEVYPLVRDALRQARRGG